MMYTRQILPVLLLLFILSSCDPGFVVELTNPSLKSKNITVILSNRDKVLQLDSIAIIDPVNPRESSIIAVSKDTSANSYSFTLEKGKYAILQHGIGGPDLTGKIVVDLSDTISLSGDKRIIETKEGISTRITIRLK